MPLIVAFFSLAFCSSSRIAAVCVAGVGLATPSIAERPSCLALSTPAWVVAPSTLPLASFSALSTLPIASAFSSFVKWAMPLIVAFFSLALRLSSCFGNSLPTGLTDAISLNPCCRAFSTSPIFWALLIPSVARLANVFTFAVSPFFSTWDKFPLLVILLFLSLFACSICLRASSLNSVVVLECHWFRRKTSLPSCPRNPAA